jgi:hypothetical protein
MDPRALLYRLLQDALIEMRYEAYERHSESVFRLADLFHNLPTQLERMERGEKTPEEIMSDLHAHAGRIRIKQWLTHRIQEDSTYLQKIRDADDGK